MSIFEDIDTYNVSGYNQAQIVALESFRLKQANRTWSVYRNNKPLAKQMKTPWIDSVGAIGQASSNGAPKACVAVTTSYRGFTEDATIGYFKVSWYINFRGQAYGQ